MELVFDRVENIVGNGENAGSSFSHNVFNISGSLKLVLCGKGFNLSQTTNSRLFQSERVFRQLFQV